MALGCFNLKYLEIKAMYEKVKREEDSRIWNHLKSGLGRFFSKCTGIAIVLILSTQIFDFFSFIYRLN